MKNLLAFLTKYKALKAKEDELHSEVESMKSELLTYIGNNYAREDGKIKFTCGQYIVTLTEVARNGIDEKALKEKFPEVASQVAKITTYDRLAVK